MINQPEVGYHYGIMWRGLRGGKKNVMSDVKMSRRGVVAGKRIGTSEKRIGGNRSNLTKKAGNPTRSRQHFPERQARVLYEEKRALARNRE